MNDQGSILNPIIPLSVGFAAWPPATEPQVPAESPPQACVYAEGTQKLGWRALQLLGSQLTF